MLSSREILKNNEIKNKLKECFNKCAYARLQIRKCVVKAINAGLTKEIVLTIINRISSGTINDEATLCAIVAIGEVFRYGEKHRNLKAVLIKDKEREKIEYMLKSCFQKCGLARNNLINCIEYALDEGLTKEEVITLSDDISGGFGKDGATLCAIIAINQVLLYEKSARKNL